MTPNSTALAKSGELPVAPVSVEGPSLDALVAELRGMSGFSRKRDIQLPASYFPRDARGPSGWIRNGDDAAAIPDGDGYCLLAAEGMVPEFARVDPWFAGFCSVMVNASDIAAMGGRSLAVVDVLFASETEDNERILSGMRDASEAFGIPVVGGHTGRSSGGSVLAAAIVGRAKRLISSFEARAGQQLLFAVDLRGAYRGPLNFNAATHQTSTKLRSRMEILPQLAERGLVGAGKDVSMAGLLGTIAMLCEASGCGAEVDLDSVPTPPDVAPLRWLASFPSYGYILAVDPEHIDDVRRAFERQEISCGTIGQVTRGTDLTAESAGQRAVYWSASEGLTGYGSPEMRGAVPTSS